MKKFQTAIPLLTVAAIASSFSFVSKVDISTSAPYFQAEISQPAYGKPSARKIGKGLIDFLGEYVVAPFVKEGASNIASEVVNRAFHPKKENVRAITNRNRSTYIGSTFIEPNRKFLFFADSRGRWFLYNSRYRRWEAYYPPNLIIYRTTDIFRDSAGVIRANRLW